MVYENNAAAMLRAETDADDSEIGTGPAALDDSGQSAAGWLSEAISKTGRVEAATTVAAIVPTIGLSTMGDAILRGMQSASQQYKRVSNEIHTSLETSAENGFSLGATLKLHMQFIEVSMEAEVVSRLVNKSTQHIDQLSKLQ